MGCPVPKVVKNGEGSALMKNPKLVYEIVAETVKAIRKPVTVKIRKGFDEQSRKCSRDCKGHRSGRGSSNCGTRKNQRAVLFRQGGLGDYPTGERSGEDSGYR